MRRRKLDCGWKICLTLTGLLLTAAAQGQTVPDATGRSNSLWVGAEYSKMEAGFPNSSNIQLQGIGAWANYNLNHTFGAEGHVRFLNFNSWYGETEQDYFAGPRYTFLHSDRWRPFARFEIGAVRIQYPFSLGTGVSFAMAPAGGLDYRLGRKWAARAAYEYQFLPNSPDFTNEPKFGIRPNGLQLGISYRVF